MCVVAIAWDCHPRWHLILAGNRDEFHGRSTAALDRWADAPYVIGGRDLQSGGSWLGISEQGRRLAVVTNLTGFGDPDPQAASRGALIADFLSGAGTYQTLAPGDLHLFNPFNLFVIDNGQARFLTNRPAPFDQTIEPGVHALSNGTRDLAWPRKERLHAAVSDWLLAEAEDPRALFTALRDTGGGGTDIHRPVFIDGPVYGTRCSTIVAIDRDGQGMIVERRYGPSGAEGGETRLSFAW
jgi:uncharacterized protein with NRDE domain